MLNKKHIDEQADFEEDEEKVDFEEDEKISKKDILAAIIAEFEILFPIVVGAVIIMWLFVMLVFKIMG